jgi:hypothetical protein
MAIDLFGWLYRLLGKLRVLTKAKAIPYIRSFEVDNSFRLDPDLSLKKYPGLSFCHIAQETVNSRLSTYWEDETHCIANAPTLQADLGLRPPIAEGLLTQLRAPSQFILKRFDLKDWIVIISGTLGAFALLHTWIASFVDAPEAQVAFVDITPLNTSAGEAISLPLAVLNESAYAPAKIKRIAALATSTVDGRTIQLQSDSG